MNVTVRRVLAGAAALAVTGSVLVVAGQSAQASVTPPWAAGDTTAKGDLSFYDGSGTLVTGGSDYNAFPAWVSASTAMRSGATKAQLVIAFPQHTNGIPSTWLQQQIQGSTTFNPAPSGTPAAINQADPFVKVNLGNSPTPIDDALSNNLTPDTTSGYENTFELRMFDSGATAVDDGGKYWRSVIEYNPTASTFDGLASGAWKVVYPAPATNAIGTTTTAPTATPGTDPAAHGTSITLTATASAVSGATAHPAGSLQFKDGSVDVGSAVAVDANGSATTPGFVPADGGHSFTAVFVPTDQVSFAGSTSTALSFTVSAPPADTTAATISGIAPASTADTTTPVVVTVHVVDSTTPASVPTGSVAVKDGTTTLGSGTLGATGSADITIPASTLSVGAHSLTAEYAGTAAFAASVSPVSAYAITLAKPAAVSPPTAGAARVGGVATCAPGVWTYAGTYSYAWYLDSAVVPFATGATTGALPVSSLGHTVECVVTVSNPAGQTQASTAKATVVLGVAPRSTVRPSIIGALRVGKKLTARVGTWSPAGIRTGYLYVWKRGSAIVSRKATYVPTAKDRRKSLVVLVYAVRSGYLTGVAASRAVVVR